MNIVWISCIAALWAVVLLLGFLLLGTLRALGVLGWRLEQLEATTPKRLGRDGLKPGKRAPEFTLPSADGRLIALPDLLGQKLLLVFTQSGCSPCTEVVPDLNRLANRGDCRVVVINNGNTEATRMWSEQIGARFPVLAQDRFSVSKLYEVFATPFAFLINEKGVIASKGIISNGQHIRYVMAGAGSHAADRHGAGEETEIERAASREPIGSFSSKEVSHV
jgi:methylamine dehydrogenase accessory protein MauD